MMNATELLQSHAQILDHANSKASRISENLDKAASAADSWMEGLSRGQAIPDSAFRVSGPLISVALRGWGQTRSILRNIEVVAVGMWTSTRLQGDFLMKMKDIWVANAWSNCGIGSNRKAWWHWVINIFFGLHSFNPPKTIPSHGPKPWMIQSYH